MKILNLAFCGILIMVFCAGCGALYGVFIAPLIPPETVPAEHNMMDKTVLIWIDDSSLSRHAPTLRRELTTHIANELLRHEAVANVINYEKIVAFRTKAHSDLPNMTIQQLGREFQADQVLYVLVNTFNMKLEVGDSYYDTSMSGYSKVIDSLTGQRLWPVGQTYKPFKTGQRFNTGTGAEFERILLTNLCKEVALYVSLPFFEHPEVRE